MVLCLRVNGLDKMLPLNPTAKKIKSRDKPWQIF